MPSRPPASAPKPSLAVKGLAPIVRALRKANSAFERAYPGDSGDRQPVHTVYGGAHLFKADTAPRLGTIALKVLTDNAPDADTFARALDVSRPPGSRPELAAAVYERVAAKLRTEPVEDFRIDFEDGYGHRDDEEEDGHARSAAHEVAAGQLRNTLPPFIGIRIKPLTPELSARSLRTLDLVVSTLAVARAKQFPERFFITIPKVTSPAQVAAVATVCGRLERRHRLRPGILRLEIMVETPQAILGPDGSSPLRKMVAAGAGRVSGAHFGTYDYTALCGITAAHQRMSHSACDFAKHMMQVALAQSGVWLSDGATNIMPVGPHQPEPNAKLTADQQLANREAVHAAWRLHFADVQHSLVSGFYQGWDLHPAQLPTRYAAVYAFFLASRHEASTRLRTFVERSAQATLVGDVFDDAATGQGLLNYFLRGLSSGAITEDEARETGLSIDELRSRSFTAILAARRGAGVTPPVRPA